MAEELRGVDRRHLRRLAHALQPVVRVGDAGVTGGVVAALDEALSHHELVKVKVVAPREERRRIADELAAGTGSVVAGTVGQVAILFRESPDEERRRIELPSRSR